MAQDIALLTDSFFKLGTNDEDMLQLIEQVDLQIQAVIYKHAMSKRTMHP
jgi:hypothetical protein